MDENPYRTPRSDCRNREDYYEEQYTPPETDWSVFLLILLALATIQILHFLISGIIS